MTVSGNRAAIGWSVVLAPSTGYYVQIDRGTFETTVIRNAYAGISDATTWSFTTSAPAVDHFAWSAVSNQSAGSAVPGHRHGTGPQRLDRHQFWRDGEPQRLGRRRTGERRRHYAQHHSYP